MLANFVLATVLERQSAVARLKYHQSGLSLIHRVADASLILSGLWLACLYTDVGWTPSIFVAGGIGVLLFNVLAESKSLYRSWRTEAMSTEIWYTVEAWLGATAVSLVAVYLQRDIAGYPAETLVIWLLGTPVTLVAGRAAARRFVRSARAHGYNTRTLAIAGSGDLAHHVASTIDDKPWMGLQVLGLFDNESISVEVAAKQELKGSLDNLLGVAEKGAVDVVFIALPPGDVERQAGALVDKLSNSAVSVYLVQDRRSRAAEGGQGSHQLTPDLWRVDLLQRRCVDIGGIKAVSVYESPFHGPSGWIKRFQDIVVGGLALILLSLPMAAIAVGVKLSGPGPVLFKQRRYGLDGKEIMVWKFRSMNVCEDRGTIAQAKKGDARVTPFGGFLRKSSLDELPQFINVLQGSMSVVGPRPHAVAHNEHYRGLIGGYMLRHKVKPGITGWAQVNGWRGETDSVDKMGRRVDYDLDYIRNWSLWLDVRIIIMTFVRGFVHTNAY